MKSMMNNVGLLMLGLSVFVAAACESATGRGPSTGQPANATAATANLTFSVYPAAT
jgi:hypothetical protein